MSVPARIQRLLVKRWFLLALLVLVPFGMWLGSGDHLPGVESVILQIKPSLITIFVLFVMAFSLDSSHLTAAFRDPAPVVWATVVNFGLLPLIAWPIARVQTLADFQIGLSIAASVPCTLAAASVWTRKANGNDAISMLVTVLTNLTCFIITPLWLNLLTAEDVSLDATEMMTRLIQTAVLPIAAGQALRQIPAYGRWATRMKTPLGVFAQAAVLLLVVFASTKAGQTLAGPQSLPDAMALVLVWLSCVAVHLLAMGAAIAGSRSFGFSPQDVAAVAFSSSQKTLPIGLLIATDPTFFGATAPYAVFPMLLFHFSQLFIDTTIADRFADRMVSASGTIPESRETADDLQ